MLDWCMELGQEHLAQLPMFPTTCEYMISLNLPTYRPKGETAIIPDDFPNITEAMEWAEEEWDKLQNEEREARQGRMSIVALKPMRLLLRAGLYEESVTIACPVTIEGEEDVVWFSDSDTPAMICSAHGDVEVLNISFPSPDVDEPFSPSEVRKSEPAKVSKQNDSSKLSNESGSRAGSKGPPAGSKNAPGSKQKPSKEQEAASANRRASIEDQLRASKQAPSKDRPGLQRAPTLQRQGTMDERKRGSILAPNIPVFSTNVQVEGGKLHL